VTKTLLRGGYVHTPADPHATALCLEDGQVVWTGDDQASLHFVDNADRIVELEGRLVTPAFVDAHAHLAQTGMAARSLDLSSATTLRDALDQLADYARRSSVTILLGFGWDETTWPEQRCFTRDEVDRAIGRRPAYLARVDVHSAVVSSAFVDAFPQLIELDGYDAAGCVSRDSIGIGPVEIAGRTAAFCLVIAGAGLIPAPLRVTDPDDQPEAEPSAHAA